MKWFRRGLAAIGLALLIWLSVLAVQIAETGEEDGTTSADVAVVLGAAAYGHRPSPVFEERIKHGIFLYKSRRVKKLLFTGGSAPGADFAEAVVARDYAIRHAVAPEAILTETASRTTRENLMHARSVMRASGLKQAIIVSDPMHLKRATLMARDLGIAAQASPTPTTRYRSFRSKAGFLLRELYFYNHYLITGR